MKCAKLFVLVFLVFEGVAALPAPPQGLLRPEDSEPRFMPRKATDEHQQSSAEAVFARSLREFSPDLASSAWVTRATEDDDIDTDFHERQRSLVRRLLQARSTEDEPDASTLDARQHSRKNVVIGSLLGLGALGTGGYFLISKLLRDKKERDRKKQQEQQQQFLPEDPAYSGGGCRRDVTDKTMLSDEQSEDRLTARTDRSWRPGRKTFAAGGLLTLAGLGLASYLGYKALYPGSKGQDPPPQFGQGLPPRRRDLGEDEADGSAPEEKGDGAHLAVRC